MLEVKVSSTGVQKCHNMNRNNRFELVVLMVHVRVKGWS